MKIDYKPALDGLRAVAVILVLVFHSDLGWLSGGFLGVSIFFTLSGFLITSLLVSEVSTTGRVDLASFWERRFRRLLPPALITIAGVCIASLWLSTPVEQSRLRGDAIASVLYASNWRSILSEMSYEDIFSTTSPLIHLWSLAIEEQMYVLLSILVATIAVLGRGRRTIGLVALALAGASAALSIWFVSGDRLYYGTDARAVELLVGVAAAAFIGPRLLESRIRIHRAVSWIPLAALASVVSIAILTSTESEWIYSGGLAAFSLLSLVCVLGTLVPGPLQALLSLSPLVHIGRLSYGLYLFHWPIFTWVDSDRMGFGGVALFAVRLVSTFVIAVLSYLLVEMPIRERRILRSRGVFAATAVSALVMTAAVPTVALESRSGEPSTDVLVLSTVPTNDPNSLPAMGNVSVLVIGDSTAENIARALATVETFGVISAGVLGCPLVSVIEVFDRPRASQETSYCPNNVDIIREHVEEIDLLFIVGGVSNQWSYRNDVGEIVDPGSPGYTRDFDALMEKFQAELAPAGVPVVVLDNPRTRPDDGVLGDEPEAHTAWRAQIERWDRDWESVVRFSIDAELAPADSSAGRVQRPDGVHLEEAFAADLARKVLAPGLRRVMRDLLDHLGRIGCRLSIDGRPRLDLEVCRTAMSLSSPRP